MMKWSATQLLDLWELGARRHPLDRALLLLAAALHRESLQQLADVPLCERDQALLRLRSANFGRALPGCVDCPACAARLEFVLDVENLYCDPPPASIAFAGMELRPPTSRDLALALQQPDAAAAARCLAQRCIVARPIVARPNASDGEPDEGLVAAVEAALAQSDQAADTVLDFQCAQCGHAWQGGFDIAAYLWQEIEMRARRLLLDIHTIARVYGWTEHEVLALSEQRRAAYIDMVAA